MTNLNKPSMKLPEVSVKLSGHDTVHTIRPNIGDMAKYDVLRSRKGWPKRDDAEVLFLVGITYLGLKRIGQLPTGYDIDQFVDGIDEFEVEEMDGAGEDADDAESF